MKKTQDQIDALARDQDLDMEFKTLRTYPVKRAKFAAHTLKLECEGKIDSYYDFIITEVDTHRRVLTKIGCDPKHIELSCEAYKAALESALLVEEDKK